MTVKSLYAEICTLALTVALILISVASFAAATEQVIFNFPKAGSGEVTLVYHSGRFYGTSPSGGNMVCSFGGCGSIFELAPNASGTWNYKTLYAFNGDDGFGPQGRVAFDSLGNLYGATTDGGVYGSGVAFKLTPTSSGQWTETIIHAFPAGTGDGWEPGSGLTQDAAGNLYGTTLDGGTNHGYGTVYKLTMNSDGTWSESLLYSFYPFPDGESPVGDLTFDQAGNLYGTTENGGANGFGMVYKLSPDTDGDWTEALTYSFDGAHGESPTGAVTLDPAGNVFGLTVAGGLRGQGAAYELIQGAGGSWSIILLHSFGGAGDGSRPTPYLTSTAADTFYGTASAGGANNAGIVFKLKQQPNGQWSENVVYIFSLANGGSDPASGLTVGSLDALFGATDQGGTSGTGVVYKITP
jgi:uncharacterized repeat protein (TIGR03803 family)